MGFFDGLQDFTGAMKLLLGSESGRRWFGRRLLRSLVLGSIMLFTFLIILGFGFYTLQAQLDVWIQVDWLTALASVGVWVIAAIVIYFSAGPITLLIMGIYLGQVGEWQALRGVEGAHLPELIETPMLLRNILNSLVLALLVLSLSIISLIPIFAFLGIVAAAYSLGKDWSLMSNEVFGGKEPERAGFGYCLGLGFLPALIASIPVVGLASLPILQVGASLRYSRKR